MNKEKQNKISWGISENLQTRVRYEPNACKGYVIDISLGCPNQCIYCLFSPLELMVYKLKNPSYKGNVLPLQLDEFLARQDFPPSLYMCYSSDPLGNQDLTGNTITILKKLFQHDIEILFITKGIFGDELIEVIRTKPNLMYIQAGIRNWDDRMNRVIEPGAPLYENRLDSLKKLTDIKGLGGLSVRIDPLLPVLDDTEENIKRIIHDISRIGIKEVIIGYVIATRELREKLRRHNLTKEAAAQLSEKTNTISRQELFSLPFPEKIKRLGQMEEWCREKGIKMKTCACKDEQLKQTCLDWVCHPFDKASRIKMMKKTGFKLEVDHLQ